MMNQLIREFLRDISTLNSAKDMHSTQSSGVFLHCESDCLSCSLKHPEF